MKKLLEKLPFYNQAVLPYHYKQSVVASTKNGFPGRKLRVIAVTGTNGKTTTCFMIWNMLKAAGYKTGLMTTVAYGVDDLKPELGHMTTVDALTLNRRIRSIADEFREKNGTIICRELLGYDMSKPEEAAEAFASGKIFGLCPDLVLETIDILKKIFAED